MRFRKGYWAAVSQWKEKIVTDKRGGKALGNSFCLFSSQDILFRQELSPFYFRRGMTLRTNGLPAFLPNFFENVRTKERVPREHLLQILNGKRDRGCGAKFVGSVSCMPRPHHTHLPYSPPHPLPAAPTGTRQNYTMTTGAPQGFPLLSQWL